MPCRVPARCWLCRTWIFSPTVAAASCMSLAIVASALGPVRVHEHGDQRERPSAVGPPHAQPTTARPAGPGGPNVLNPGYPLPHFTYFHLTARSEPPRPEAGAGVQCNSTNRSVSRLRPVSPFVMHVTRKAMHQVDSGDRRLSPPRATLPPMGAGIGSDRIPGRYPQCWRPAFLHCASNSIAILRRSSFAPPPCIMMLATASSRHSSIANEVSADSSCWARALSHPASRFNSARSLRKHPDGLLANSTSQSRLQCLSRSTVPPIGGRVSVQS